MTRYYCKHDVVGEGCSICYPLKPCPFCGQTGCDCDKNDPMYKDAEARQKINIQSCEDDYLTIDGHLYPNRPLAKIIATILNDVARPENDFIRDTPEVSDPRWVSWRAAYYIRVALMKDNTEGK